MKGLLAMRIAFALIGIAVWGYGQRINDKNLMWAGMAIMAVALILRFIPKRWFQNGAP